MIQKIVENGCIASIASGASVGNISEEEYSVILSVIRNKPEAASGYDYKLHEDLTWELYELPAPKEDEAAENDSEKVLNTPGGEHG